MKHQALYWRNAARTDFAIAGLCGLWCIVQLVLAVITHGRWTTLAPIPLLIAACWLNTRNGIKAQRKLRTFS